MEKTVRIISQSRLVTRKHLDKRTGVERENHSIILKLTDGLDTFVAEIAGDRALNCPKFDPTYQYRVHCSMVVRERVSQQTGEQLQSTIIYIDRINLI